MAARLKPGPTPVVGPAFRRAGERASVLEAAHLYFRYGASEVLRDVSVTVAPGSLVGILGPNGAGKTTLLRLLAGTLRPHEGEVTLDGHPLGRFTRAVLARRIAVVPQETSFTFDYTGIEIVLMGRYAHLGAFQLEDARDYDIALHALAATGTRAFATRPIATLSGGEKQRVVIASALAQLGDGDRSDMPSGASRSAFAALLLDEPTASLDPAYQLEVRGILARLNRDRRIAVVVSTHDLAFAATLCRELVLIRDGCVLAAGPTDEVLTPSNIESLYGITADVRRHDVAGHLVVVPLGRGPASVGRVSSAVRPEPFDAVRPEPVEGTNGAQDRPVERPRPARGAKSASASERGWGPASAEERRTLGAGVRPATGVASGFSRTLPSLRRRLLATYAIFGSFAVVACLAAPFVGSTPISVRRVFDTSIPFADNIDAQIFFVARLPRAIAGALVGSTLAAAGVVFQALLRNPLATPFTLGVSAGAALGAILALTLGQPLGFSALPTVPVAAFAGSLGAVSIVYALSTFRQRGFSTTVLLLAGVTLNAFFSALITFVQYLSDFTQTIRIVRWTMGDLDVSSFQPILAALPLTLAAFVAFAWLPRALNLLSLGAESAEARGVDARRAQRVAFFSGSVATGAAVSLAGPVGFIGIIVPQLVRLLVGADHRVVLPAAALFGAAFLVACDVAARTAFTPLELPIGIVTAMIGGPFFLWLLIRSTVHS